MRRLLMGCTAVACALAFVGAGSAFAHAGHLTPAESYPAAFALCAKARANDLPKKLEAKRAQVITACDTLFNAYGPLVATVDAAEATLLSTLSAQKALVAAACTRPIADRPACRAARATAASVDAA